MASRDSGSLKILLVQTSFLGDVILSTPLITALKQLYPQSELWMMTTPAAASLVERDPLLSGVIKFDKRGSARGIGGLKRMANTLREMKFDRAYALQRSLRTSVLLALARIPLRTGFKEARASWLFTSRVKRLVGEHDVKRNLSLLSRECDIKTLPDSMRLFAPSPNEINSDLRSIVSAKNFIAVVPGSAWKTKRWHVDGYREVVGHFLKKGIKVVVLGAPGEESVAGQVSAGFDVINLAGRTSLSEFIAVLASAKALVCNDSMALHAGSAFQVPTVTVFCATTPAFGFGPWKNRARVIERKDLACKPCRRHGSHECPSGTELCMRGVPGAEVISATEELVSL